MKGFRVWSNYWKKYAIEAELYMDGSVDAIFEDADGVPHHENTDLVVEFPTGLKDKNGKEIYEGDIVKNIEGINETAFCVWDESNAEFDFRSKDGKYTKDNVKAWLEMYEVVGNIHENQDLLGDMNTTSKEEE